MSASVTSISSTPLRLARSARIAPYAQAGNTASRVAFGARRRVARMWDACNSTASSTGAAVPPPFAAMVTLVEPSLMACSDAIDTRLACAMSTMRTTA